MEAKRYTTRLSYDALATKLLEALERSGRNVEVWCAASTVPFDAIDAGDLRAMGERRGTTVLILDWAQPMPPLAVLLAAARDAVLNWFSRNAGDTINLVDGELAAISTSPLYFEQVRAIRIDFQASTLGLAVARRQNALWMEEQFSDVHLALHRFNQALAPLDGSLRPTTLERARLEARIRTEIGVWRHEPGVVVLTGLPEHGSGDRGDEGVGKTWAVVRSWLTFPDVQERPRPLLLIMASHMWREGDERAPLALLARLAAEQTGAVDGDLQRWQVKLERWLVPNDTSLEQLPAIVLVLDGVNERTHHPWPALISELTLAARSRTLRIVITTRRGIYERDLAPRLRSLNPSLIEVETFSNEELDDLLMQAGRAPASVREPLRGFLRNPRILSVGLDLLDRLDPDEVGVERLLFEYLRRRQEERGRGGAHTAEELAQVLVHHAREIRDRLASQIGGRRAIEFEDSTIFERLGRPAGSASLVEDLGEIIDSGFIRIVDLRRRRYALREHGRSLGLGLLVVDELDLAARDCDARLDRVLDAIVDPIRAIDETALVLLAALDVALVDRGIDHRVAQELLHQILSLQNVPAAQRARVFAGVRDRPEIYVAVAERLYGEPSPSGRREWMREALVSARSHPIAEEVLDEAARQWLRLWQPEPSEPDVSGYADEQALSVRNHHAEAVREHRAELERLTVQERSFVERELVRMAPGHAHGVDELAVALLAGRPLAAFAGDLFAWCVAAACGWRAGGTLEAVRWLLRLAPVDWRDTVDAIDRRAAAFPGAQASANFHWAIQYALTASGDPEQARRADETWPLLREGPRRRLLDMPGEFPDVDPLDPTAPEPASDLTGLAELYRRFTQDRENEPPSVLMRSADSPSSRARLILCRFRPDAAADLHLDLIRRLPAMQGASPSLLAGFVAQDAAIVAPLINMLLSWYDELRHRADLPLKEAQAPTQLLVAILPHLDAAQRLDAHAGQRAEAEDAYWLGSMLAVVPIGALREHLTVAAASGDEQRLRFALIAAAQTRAVDAVRDVASEALASSDTRLRAAAARTMACIGEPSDHAAFVSSGWSWARHDANPSHLRENFWKSIWLAKAKVGEDDPTLLQALHPAIRSPIVAWGGERLAVAAVDDLTAALSGAMQMALVPDGLDIRIMRPDDLTSEGAFVGSWHQINFPTLDVAIEVADGTRRRTRDLKDFLAFERELIEGGLESLLYPLSSAAIDRIASASSAAFDRLIGAVEGGTVSPFAAVLAHDIARVLSMTNPTRAAALFTRYEDVAPAIPEIMPLSRVVRTSLLLWRSAASPEIAAVRSRRLTAAASDRSIAREVLAAEMAGGHEELFASVTRSLASDHPAVLARALTVIGFMTADPRLNVVFEDARFRHGFLSDVRDAAMRSYNRARWAEHWFTAARTATTDLDIWRFCQLAAASADARCILWLDQPGGVLFESLRPLTRSALEAAAQRCDSERRDRLFGSRMPPTWLLERPA